MFQQLQSLNQHSTELRERRSLSSDKAFEKATQYLIQAHEEAYAQPETLQQALRYFLDAIKQNRRNPTPYLMVAFIFGIYQNRPQAYAYFEAARRIDPHNPELEYCQSLLQSLEAETQESYHPELEHKYQELRQHIRTSLVYYQNQAWPEVGPTEAHWQALNQYIQALIRQETQFESARHELSASMPTQTLEIEQEKLGAIRQKLEVQLSYCQALKSLKENILSIENKCLSIEKHLHDVMSPEQLKEFEGELELFLDQTDKIADQLDRLDELGVLISSIEPHYNQLINVINTLTDHLDEHLDSLKAG